ncbi:MAG: hypothetical protein LBM94_00360 [Propionibacteriaceae bacterium]|nr:hypothetical protein [Propionibacteriaceae bacterium]
MTQGTRLLRWPGRILALGLAILLSVSLAGLTALGDPVEPTPSETPGTSAPEQATPEESTPAPEPSATESDPAPESEPPVDEPPVDEYAVDEPAAAPPTEEHAPAQGGATGKPGKTLGAEPIEEINEALVINIGSSFVNEVQSGQTAVVPLAIQAGVPGGADGGLLVVVPVYKGLSNTTVPATGNAAVQYVDDYAVPGTAITLDHALLIWKYAPSPGTSIFTLNINYVFENGSTPDGFLFDFQAYIYEAIVSGNNQVGTGVRPEAGHNATDAVTVTVHAAETWTATKTVTTPSVAFGDLLKERAFADVAIDGDAEDNYSVTYQVVVASNKPNGSYGRLFMNSLRVSDTLSGFLATGAPTSIVVKENGTALPAEDVTIQSPTSTSRNIQFNVPSVVPTAFSDTHTFDITVTFDKDDYTNRYAVLPALLTVPQEVTNAATVTYAPVSGAGGTSAPSTTAVKFGWNQAEPTLPTLTINTKLTASSSTRDYTAAMAKVWENNSSLGVGSSSAVQYTLARVQGCGDTQNTAAVIGVTRTAALLLGQDSSHATFSDVEPGCYRLYQSTTINGTVDTTLVQLTAGVLIEVELNETTGATTLWVGEGPARTSQPGTGEVDINANNTATASGYVKVYTKRQDLKVYPTHWHNYEATMALYDDSSAGATLVATASYLDTESDALGGSYLFFENVPMNGGLQPENYYLRDLTSDGQEDLYSLYAVVKHDPAVPTDPPAAGATTTVKVETTVANKYTAFLSSNTGGMTVGKVLQNPDGSYNTTQQFKATYGLYDSSSCSLPLQVGGIDAKIAVTNRSANKVVDGQGNVTVVGAVNMELPPGTYCVKEESLVDGSNNSLEPQYVLYQGNNLRVTIVAGSYGATFTSLDANDAKLLPQPGNGVLDAGTGAVVNDPGSEYEGVMRHINVSRAGELVIRNFNAAGAAVGNTFTVTKTDFIAANDGWWSATDTKTITVGASGDYRAFVPAGTYNITPSNASPQQVVFESMGYAAAANTIGTSSTVSVQVAGGTEATPLSSAVSVASGQINGGSVPTTAASKQTALFNWKYKPIVTVEKKRAKNGVPEYDQTGMTAAKFALYRLDGSVYQLVKGDISVTDTPASSAYGVVTTPNLQAGTYILVEVTVPGQFVEPSYMDAQIFKTGAVVNAQVAQVTAESYIDDNYVQRFTITTSEYSNTTAVQNLKPANWSAIHDVLNVPLTTIVVNLRDRADGSPISGGVFNRCSTPTCTGNSDPVATMTTASPLGTLDLAGLTPGTHYIRQASAPTGYVATDKVVQVVVDANGWPTLSLVDDTGSGLPTFPAAATPSNGGSVPNYSTVTWPNAKAPVVNWMKSGEVMNWATGGGRQTEALNGACFTLTDNVGNHYDEDSSHNVFKAVDQDAAPHQFCSGLNGGFEFETIAPLVYPNQYTLTEVVVPPIPGENAAGLVYEPSEVKFSFEWKEAGEHHNGSAAGYWLVLGDGSQGLDSEYRNVKYHGGASSAATTYEIVNKVKEFQISIYVLPLRLANGDMNDGSVGTLAGGFAHGMYDSEERYIGDPSPSSLTWEGVVVPDAIFKIYEWIYDDDSHTAGQRGPLVDTVVVAGNDISQTNVGWSMGLPAGFYEVVQDRSALLYAALDTWPGSDTAYPNGSMYYPKGDQITSVYYQLNKKPGTYVNSVNMNYDPVGTPSGDGVSTAGWVAGGVNGKPAIIELGQGPLGGDDPDTSWNEGGRSIMFGNSNRVRNIGGYLNAINVRFFGQKDGYQLNVESGEYELTEAIGGVKFNAYPAFRDENGAYIQLPTIGGLPIATATSAGVGDDIYVTGQFLTTYMNMTRVFECLTAVGELCDDWPDADKDVPEDTSDEAYHLYDNWFENDKGKILVPGAEVVDGAVDWAAVVADSNLGIALKYKYANERNDWGVVLVEQPKQTGAGCPGAPDEENGYCTPLSEDYDWNPSVPPTFGFSGPDDGLHWKEFITFYGNGDSIIGTGVCETENKTEQEIAQCLSALPKPEPISFPNYKGVGYLDVNKYSEVLTAGSPTPLSGATFELYAVDSDFTDFPAAAACSGNAAAIEACEATKAAKLALALEHSTLVTEDRNGVSTYPYLTATPDPEGLKLTAGAYLLVEKSAPNGHNTYGSWDTRLCADTASACNASSQATTLNRSGTFASDGAIGVIYIAHAPNATHPTTVSVVDKLRPSATIVNSWSGATITSATYTGTYSVEAASPATPPASSVTSTGDGTTSGNLNFLQDGTYTVKLTNLFDTASWNLNPNASTDSITFTVDQSRILIGPQDGPKVGTTSLSSNKDAALTTGQGIWYSVNADRTHIDFYVNHIAKGQVIVLKGGITDHGVSTDAPADLTSATFSYEYVGPGSCGNSNCQGTFQWTTASSSTGGARQPLDPGVYKITETAVVGAGWKIDPVPVYVDIQAEGAIYLKNNPGTGAGSDQANPQTSSNIPAYFRNIATKGTFEIKKFSATGTTNLAGAHFKVYPTIENGTTPSGPAVVEDLQAASSKYEFTVEAGYYLLQETVAPTTGCADLTGGATGPCGLRTDYIYIEVKAGTAPNYVGPTSSSNVNVAVVRDPDVLRFDVAKETTYPAIGTVGDPGYLAARTARVGSLPITLWSRTGGSSNTKADFIAVQQDIWYVPTSPNGLNGIGPSIGAARFAIDRPGEYRVTEFVGAEHKYLLTNCDYRVQTVTGGACGEDVVFDANTPNELDGSALLGRAPKSIFVVYNTATNKLEVDVAASSSDWVPATNPTDPTKGNHYGELIINNEFIGYVIAVQKRDALTGELITTGPAFAKFEQYDTLDHANAEGTTGRQQSITLDNTGLGMFNPDYTSTADPRVDCDNGGCDDNNDGYLNWWIKEDTAPTGYAINDWFDDPTKQVKVDLSSGTADQYVLQFANGKNTSSNPGISKAVKAGALGSGTNQVTSSLVNGGFSTTYVLDLSDHTNTIPMVDYAVTEGSATVDGLQFYGQNKANGQVLGTPIANGSVPYALTSVTIQPSYAYKNASDLAEDWGTTAPASDDNMSPVYARVNGGAWQLLDVARSFTVPAESDRYLKVEYTSVRPGTDISPFDHSETPTDIYPTEAAPIVGAYFTPGDIEVNVTFEKWEPGSERPEIMRIDNTAKVNAKSYLGATTPALTEATDSAQIAVPVVDRATLAVGLGCTDEKCDPVQTPDINDRKFFQGEPAQFTIAAKNTHATLGAPDPVLIAYMDSDMFSVDGDPGSFTVKVGGATYGGAVEFSTPGTASVGIWSFPGLILAPGEEIEIEFQTVIADVMVTQYPQSYGYAGSAADLLATDKYPTGSAIDGVAGCNGSDVAPSFRLCGDRVYDQSADGTYPATANETWRVEDWTRLDNITGTFSPDAFGLFVRAARTDFVVNSTGEVNGGKFVKVGASGAYSGSRTASEINLGNEVGYRLVLANSQGETTYPESGLTNLRFVDVLPFPGDERDEEHGLTTEWAAELRELWHLDIDSFVVRTSTGGVIPSTEYDLFSTTNPPTSVSAEQDAWFDGSMTEQVEGLTEDATSFYVKFGQATAPGTAIDNYVLRTGDVLFIEYSMVFDDAWEDDSDDLLALNANKLSANSYGAKFQMVDSESKVGGAFNLESNTVGAQLVAPKVTISGIAWEDRNYDGKKDAADNVLANVPVELWSKVGTGPWAPAAEPEFVTFPTQTNALGEYAFTGLESSAGDGSGAITYQVRFGKPSTGTWNYTLKDYASATEATDSDVYTAAVTGPNARPAGSTDDITLYSDLTTVSAGLYQLNSISGVVWEDLNDNGQQDDGTGPHNVLAGTTVTLTGTDSSGYAIPANTTATVSTTDGSFSFANLKSGSYTLTFDKTSVAASGVTFKWAVLNSGDDATDSDVSATSRTDASASLTVSLGYSTPAINIGAGVVPTVSISGIAWEDTDFDGLKGGSEANLANVPVSLWLHNGTQFTQVTTVSAGGTLSAATAAGGTYAFEGVKWYGGDNRYQVRFGLPTTVSTDQPWTRTATSAAANGSDAYQTADTVADPAIAAGSTALFVATSNTTNLDAGYYHLSKITGVVWSDDNSNGIHDGTEAGVANVEVTLWKIAAGQLVQRTEAGTQTTGSNGEYTFAGLKPADYAGGSYYVMFDKTALTNAQVIRNWTSDGEGEDADIDSDAVPYKSGGGATVADPLALTAPVAIPYNSETAHIDAGITRVVKTITGSIWEDKNYDGQRTDAADDVAWNGVTVNLYRAADGANYSGTPYATTTSAAGTYTFNGPSNNGAGIEFDGTAAYRVEVVKPTPTVPGTTVEFTTANTGAEATDSDVTGVGSPTTLGRFDGITAPATVDAGLFREGSISGYAWSDTDKDGAQDGGEPAVGGLAVTLYKSTDLGVSWQVVASPGATTTSGAGTYTFAGLRPGLYRVLFDKTLITNASVTYNWTRTDGGTATTNSDAVPYVAVGVATAADPLAEAVGQDLAYNAAIANIDAGLTTELKTITGYVWEDKNYDGSSASATDDVASNNVTVKLYQSLDGGASYSASAYATTTTSALGQYTFNGPNNDGTGVAFGTDIAYRIEVTKPGATTGTTTVFTTGADSDVTAVGASDLGRFEGITAPTSVDAGWYRLGSVSGTIWEDLDADGTRDDGTWTHSLTATTVTLSGTDITGAAIPANTTATVNADGTFTFTGLKAANASGYTVTFNKSAVTATNISFKWTLAGQGAAGTDSDAAYTNPWDNTAAKAGFAYAYAEALLNYDAGLVPYITISGSAWEDVNYNGGRDGSEAVLFGVPVTLYKSVNNGAGQAVSASAGYAAFNTATDGLGTYTFDGVPWAANTQYWVRFGTPTDASGQAWTRTARQATGVDTATDSDAYADAFTGTNPARAAGDTHFVTVTTSNLNAGYYRLSEITGYLWYDANDNGQQDAGEDPVDGSVDGATASLQRWNVDLDAWEDVTSQTIGNDGTYAFTGLRSGTYRVEFDKTLVLDDSKTFDWTSDHVGATVTDSDAVPYVDSETEVATPSSPLAEVVNISVPYNTAVANIDGGLLPVSKKVEGYVWEDKNYDGLADDPLYENPLEDIEVELYRSDDSGDSWTLYASTVTDSDGWFSFTGPGDWWGNPGPGGMVAYAPSDPNDAGVNFAAGASYLVKVLAPNADSNGVEWFFTQQDGANLIPDVINDDPVDPDSGHAASASTTVLIWTPTSGLTAGLYRLGNIVGSIWEDLNNDGIQNEDPGITGHDLTLVTARLTGTDDTGEQIDRTVNVEEDGTYVFYSLKSGTYAISFDRTALDGAVPTNTFEWSLTHQTNDITLDSDAEPSPSRLGVEARINGLPLAYAGAAQSQDAGIVPFVHITGFAWFDEDRDGELDGNESKTPGVTVTLWRGEEDGSLNGQGVANYINEAVVDNTVTDADGNYVFDELLYDANTVYKVVFTNPDSKKFMFTTAGVHHTASELVETAPGVVGTNEHIEAHTAYIMTSVAHSNEEGNAGLRGIDVAAPTGGSVNDGTDGSVALAIMALTTGAAALFGATRRRKQENE